MYAIKKDGETVLPWIGTAAIGRGTTVSSSRPESWDLHEAKIYVDGDDNLAVYYCRGFVHKKVYSREATRR